MDLLDEAKDGLAAQFGYASFYDEKPRIGWLLNYDVGRDELTRMYVDLYFVDEKAEGFTVRMPYYPSFLIEYAEDPCAIEEDLSRRYEGQIEGIEPTTRIDVEEHNHLNRAPRRFLKVSVRRERDFAGMVRELSRTGGGGDGMYRGFCEEGGDPLPRPYEHDIPVDVQVGNTLGIRCGRWHSVAYDGASYRIGVHDRLTPPDLRVFAFDIETTKPPLKFPNAMNDEVMMISVMTESFGELIVSRSVVGADIKAFEYVAKDEMRCTFRIANEANEEALLVRFVELVQTHRPHIITTYNGGHFDWPFVEQRAARYGIDIAAATSVGAVRDYYASPFVMHLDCYKWVRRDSYLPMNNQGLKDAARIKLDYFPDEIDPEDMVRCAAEEPQRLASYSVSDAVATYYLFVKYVQPHIFSIASIIPLPTVQVLCRGSGTLCEALLFSETISHNLLVPQKRRGGGIEYRDGHIVNNLTYVGGHVESLRAGIFRADFEHDFNISGDFIDLIIRDLDQVLAEEASSPDYPTAREAIVAQLDRMRGNTRQTGSIYHLDVGAMYPNIILTNRLQPISIVNEDVCIHCDFNGPENDCKRRMAWVSRTDYLPPTANDIRMIKNQLSGEFFYYEGNEGNGNWNEGDENWNEGDENEQMEEWRKSSKKASSTMENIRVIGRKEQYSSAPIKTPVKIPYDSLPVSKQESILRERVTEYSRKIYKRVRKVEERLEELTVCQREVPFYVETIRKFRDQRNAVKRCYKRALGEYEEAPTAENKKRIVMYNSLQIAYKCVLNSFYGYVMRRGSRWFSLEMAAAVCHVGGEVIRLAKDVTEMIGIALELDTDGIWCLLPAGFPSMVVIGQRRVPLIGCILNYFVCKKFTNSQYQVLASAGPPPRYEATEQNSIAFEVDGPYRTMVIPSSTEENRLLKKRYVVFDTSGAIAELKGFELKRRGELNIVKKFQADLFEHFNDGATLQECYDSIAATCNYWLDIIHSGGAALPDDAIFDLFSESRCMSKSIEGYGDRKSNIMSTARKMAELLGSDILDDKLKCEFIICRFPANAPTAERCIPVLVFRHRQRDHFLSRWLGTTCSDPKQLVDWDYYRRRFDNILQRLVVIPAHFQNIKNPLDRVALPPWISKTEGMGRLDFGRAVDIEDTVPYVKIIDRLYSSAVVHSKGTILESNVVTDHTIVTGHNIGSDHTIVTDHNSNATSIPPSIIENPQIKMSLSGIEPAHIKNIIHSQSNHWLEFYKRKDIITKIELSTSGTYKLHYLNGSTETRPFLRKVFLDLNEAEAFAGCVAVRKYLPGSLLPSDIVCMEIPDGPAQSAKYRKFFDHFAIKGAYNADLNPMFQLLADHSTERIQAPHAVVTSLVYQKKSIFCITAASTAFVCPTKPDPAWAAGSCGRSIQHVSLETYRRRHLGCFPIVVYNQADPNARQIEEAWQCSVRVPLSLQHSVHLEDLESLLRRQCALQLRMKEEYTALSDVANLFKMPLLSVDNGILDYAYYKELALADTLCHPDPAFVQSVVSDESFTPGYFATYTLQLECTNSLLLAIIEHAVLVESNALFDGTRRREFTVVHDFLKKLLIAALQNGHGIARLVDRVARWLKKESTLISADLRELLNILQQKYLIGLVHKLKAMQCKVVSASKELLIIDSGKTDQASCAAYCAYLKKKVAQIPGYELLALQPLRTFERLGFVAPDCYFYIAGGQILSFSDTQLPLRFLSLYFADPELSNETVYALVSGMEPVQARLLLRLLSYRRSTHGLASNCYKLLRVSEFVDEPFYKHNLSIFCPHCGIEVILRRSCLKCCATIESRFIETECLAYLSHLWQMQAAGERHCGVCNACEEFKLKDYCRCGGKFTIRNYISEIIQLKGFVNTRRFDEEADKVLEYFRQDE